MAQKVDRKIHPHVKPIGLITRLIAAVTQPGDLVVDPAAGSFVVMRAAHQLGRDFIGCDLAFPESIKPEKGVSIAFLRAYQPRRYSDRSKQSE